MIGLIQEPASLDQSDRDLQRRLRNFLQAREIPGSLNIGIDVHRGTVVLRGSLPSPQARRLCLECCRHVAGVIDLKDDSLVCTDCRPSPGEDEPLSSSFS
jgi:osmotically-inducible protein OsmY